MSKKRSKKIEEPIKEDPTKKEDNQQLEDTSDVDELQLEKEKFLRLFAEFENYKKCIILIEWPQLITAKTTDKIEMYFKYSDNLNTRHVHIKSFGRCNDYKFEKF